MSGSAKIVKLKAFPSVSVNLAFEVGGIVETVNIALGQTVTAFDLSTFYGGLGTATETQIIPIRVVEDAAVSTALPKVAAITTAPAAQAAPVVAAPAPTSPAPAPVDTAIKSGLTGVSGVGGVGGPTQTVPIPANLYNSSDISNNVSGSQLMSLRAESVKAALDRSCAQRANLYYSKFANQSAIITTIQGYYSPDKATSKPAYLTQLASLATQQYGALNAAYSADSERNLNGASKGVVQSTASTLQSTAPTVTTTNSPAGAPATSTAVPSAPANAPIVQTQNMTYTDYGYRIPSIEAEAQNLRAQISLIDEQFNQYLAGQSLSNLTDVFTNELTAIDMEVKRLQVAYLNTILFFANQQPITGVVTGIYKQVGDAVIAGETVARVESNSSIFLVGVLIYRGLLSIGNTVTVVANLFSLTTPTTLAGKIVAVRGDESGDDHWSVVISYTNNDGNGNPVLPLNYNFDFDDITSVTIS